MNLVVLFCCFQDNHEAGEECPYYNEGARVGDEDASPLKMRFSMPLSPDGAPGSAGPSYKRSMVCFPPLCNSEGCLCSCAVYSLPPLYLKVKWVNENIISRLPEEFLKCFC